MNALKIQIENMKLRILQTCVLFVEPSEREIVTSSVHPGTFWQLDREKSFHDLGRSLRIWHRLKASVENVPLDLDILSLNQVVALSLMDYTAFNNTSMPGTVLEILRNWAMHRQLTLDAGFCFVQEPCDQSLPTTPQLFYTGKDWTADESRIWRQKIPQDRLDTINHFSP